MKKASKETIKYINKQNILNVFWKREEVAKTEIIEATHLSAATVSALIQELVAENYLNERRIGESSGGRRPIMYELNRELSYVLTIRVTTKGIMLDVVDLSGEIVHHKSTPGYIFGEPALVDSIKESMEIFFKTNMELAKNISVITFSLPGVVDYKNCILTYSAALFVENCNLVNLVGELFVDFKETPAVYVFKDTDALALGEVVEDADKNYNMAYFLCENGVGLSIINRGTLFRMDNCGLEIGHTTIDINGANCKCGKNGCVGVMLGEQPAVRAYAKLCEENKKEYIADHMKLTYDDLISMYLEGDIFAKKVIDEQLETLSVVMTNVVNMFNPDRLVLGGALARLPQIETQVAQKVKQNALKPFTQKLSIASSTLGIEASLIGMANYVLKKEVFKSFRF